MIAIVLAAGASRRMGRDKAEIFAGGATLLDRAVAAVAAHPTIVVLPPRLVRGRADVVEVPNNEPARGMTHSLRLALRTARNGRPAGAVDAAIVTLVDTPLVDAPLVRAVAQALAGADVAHPIRDGRPGHPVAFSARALARLASLGEGDTLRRLRDDPALTRHLVAIAAGDERPFLDLDDAEGLAAFPGSGAFPA